MSDRRASRRGSFPGWILVTGLILLCLAGTGLTWLNYSRHVFSSAHGVVLEHQWPEPRIEVSFSAAAAGRILPGHIARITFAHDKTPQAGRVVEVTRHPEKTEVLVAMESGQRPKPGNPCSVTIDTTIPPDQGVR